MNDNLLINQKINWQEMIYRIRNEYIQKGGKEFKSEIKIWFLDQLTVKTIWLNKNG